MNALDGIEVKTVDMSVWNTTLFLFHGIRQARVKQMSAAASQEDTAQQRGLNSGLRNLSVLRLSED